MRPHPRILTNFPRKRRKTASAPTRPAWIGAVFIPLQVLSGVGAVTYEALALKMRERSGGDGSWAFWDGYGYGVEGGRRDAGEYGLLELNGES